MRSSTITLAPRSPADDGHLPAGFCFALVNAVGRLSVLDAPGSGVGLFPLGRRTISGLVWRVDLDHGLVCWLDGDAHDRDGRVNLAATGMSLHLLGEQPWTLAEPYLCGPVLFTGSGQANQPAGLSEQQLWLVAEAHANAEPWTTTWSQPSGDHCALKGARR
jgi:hypothetical protein